MTPAMRAMVLNLLAVVCVGAAIPTEAVAQVPSPTLTTTISPPPANQSFEAVFHVFASPEATGFGASPQINVVGNSINIQFLGGCPQPCAPPGYSAFPFTMPALPAGEYQVRFGFFLPSPPLTLAILPLTVGAGANPVAVPSMSTRWLSALVFLLAIAGVCLVRRRSIRPHS